MTASVETKLSRARQPRLGLVRGLGVVGFTVFGGIIGFINEPFSDKYSDCLSAASSAGVETGQYAFYNIDPKVVEACEIEPGAQNLEGIQIEIGLDGAAVVEFDIEKLNTTRNASRSMVAGSCAVAAMAGSIFVLRRTQGADGDV